MTLERFRMPGAMVIPGLAWFGYQQGMSYGLQGACGYENWPVGTLFGAMALALCALGAWLALPLARAPGSANQPSKFLGRVALCMAGVFALAVLFQTLATLIVPSCVR